MTSTTLERDTTLRPDVPSDEIGNPPIITVLGAVTLSAALTGCGGGGGGDSTSPVVTPPVIGPVTVAPTASQSARFLAQASLAISDADLSVLQQQGYSDSIEAQIVAPRSQSHWDWLVAKGYSDAAQFRNSQAGLDNTMWRKFITSPDLLRQRVVLALTEIFVVSPGGINTSWRQFVCGAYLDILDEHCFGTFRNLLEQITLSIAMGSYLNMRGNQREDLATGRQPDENYAREVLQLFSIGLVELNQDGTPRLSASGQPIESYNPAMIAGLAKVFTGWDYSTTGPTLTTAPDRARVPMQFFAARFSPSVKSFLGVTIPAATDGVTALSIALDTIANHSNVAPFISRQLIQRLVTSNPSPAYVGRVAAAFNNTNGVRGDMKAVIRAVLLDVEARTDDINPASTWGKLREPMLRFIQWARTFSATSTADTWAIGDTSDTARALGQSPLRAPSVFNFFRPGYVPPNSSIGSLGLVAPELQITNESSVVGYSNYMQTTIGTGVGPTVAGVRDIRGNYAGELPRANDPPGLVDRYALLLTGDQLTADTKSRIQTAIASIDATTDAGRLNRIYAAVLLIMCSPEYLVQK